MEEDGERGDKSIEAKGTGKDEKLFKKKRGRRRRGDKVRGKVERRGSEKKR